MAINAYERFKGGIVDSLVDYDWKSNREISDIEEMKSILRLLSNTDSGFTYEDIAKQNLYRMKNLEMKILENTNGFRYVDSSISFIDKEGNSNTIQQIFVLDKENDKPLVLLVKKAKKVGIQYFLCSPSHYGGHLRENDKHILIEDATYEVNPNYICAFTSYTDLNYGALLMESYKRGDFYHLNELCDNGLSAELGAESKKLEFLYHDNQLNYVQITNEGEVSKEGAMRLVEHEIQDFLLITYEKLVGKRGERVRKKQMIMK